MRRRQTGPQPKPDSVYPPARQIRRQRHASAGVSDLSYPQPRVLPECKLIRISLYPLPLGGSLNDEGSRPIWLSLAEHQQNPMNRLSKRNFAICMSLLPKFVRQKLYETDKLVCRPSQPVPPKKVLGTVKFIGSLATKK